LADSVIELEGQRCLVADAGGPTLRDANGARDLVEAAMSQRASVIVVPVSRLDPEFFRLASGVAGEVVQKVLNYRRKFAVVGDISAHIAASDAFRDFVVETEHGHDIIFAADMPALAGRLAALRAPAA